MTEFGVLLATMNGPAPTGWSRNCFSPSFFTAVGEAIQSAVESMKELMIDAYTVASLMTTVLSPCAVIDLTGHMGLQVQGDFRSRLMFHTTASALNGVPSVNFTPCRRLMVTVLPPLANFHP